MKKVALFFIIISGLLIISGCGRLVDWGNCTFNQGSSLIELTCLPRSYVRSVQIYDQVLTSAKFSALPLLDKVLESYASIYARKMGMSYDEQHDFLEQWKSEQVSGLTFYVTSLYDYPLGTSNSVWGIFAEIDGENLRPISIKKTELSPEFKVFFGKEFTIFRDAYLISFDIDSSTLGSVSIKLFFRSITKQALLCWNTFDNNQDCHRC